MISDLLSSVPPSPFLIPTLAQVSTEQIQRDINDVETLGPSKYIDMLINDCYDTLTTHWTPMSKSGWKKTTEPIIKLYETRVKAALNIEGGGWGYACVCLCMEVVL
jgi:flagellin-specific chaperone FliS